MKSYTDGQTIFFWLIAIFTTPVFEVTQEIFIKLEKNNRKSQRAVYNMFMFKNTDTIAKRYNTPLTIGYTQRIIATWDVQYVCHKMYVHIQHLCKQNNAFVWVIWICHYHL